MKRSAPRLIATLLIALVAGCEASPSSTLVSEGQVMFLDDPVAVLTFKAVGPAEICIPSYQFSPVGGSFVVRDGRGAVQAPNVLADRPFYPIKGLDLANGLTVISPERGWKVLVNLDNYDLEGKAGISAEFDLEYVVCKEFFAAQKPSISRLKVIAK